MKKINKQLKYENTAKYRHVLNLLLAGAIFVLVYYKSGIWFETNDDIFIYSLLSGDASGICEAHTIYNNILFSLPISLLYRIFPQVSWYGYIILGFHLASFIVTEELFTSRCKNYIEYYICIVTTLFFFISSWYIRSAIQYTSIGIILAATGFLCLFLSENKKQKVWLFGIFEFLSFVLRPETMEIVQPIGFLTYIGLQILKCSEKKDVKLIVKKVCPYITISLSIIVLGLVANRIAYGGDEYVEALKINDARTVLFDYYYTPEYSEIEKIATDNGMTEAEYNAFTNYVLQDYSQNADAIVEISNFVEKNNPKTFKPLELIKLTLWDSYSKEYANGINKVVIVAWILCFVILAFAKNIKALIPIAMYGAGKMISWGYIFYRGRSPERIMIPLYLCEILFALSIALLSYKMPQKKWLKMLSTAVLTVSLCLFLQKSFVTGREQMRYLATANENYILLDKSENEILDYCKTNSQNNYIVSSRISMYWKKRIFDCIPRQADFMFEGGWFSCIPSVYRYNFEYLSKDNLYLISVAEQDDIVLLEELDYYEERFGTRPKKVDSIPLSTGAEAFVYELH